MTAPHLWPSRRLGRLGAVALVLASLPLAWYCLRLTGGSAETARGARLRELALSSRWLSRPLRAWVYLPPGYDHARNRRRRYPVVYLLHSCPGQPRDWLEAGEAGEIEDRLVAQGEIRPMILVAADGRAPGGPGDCTGWLDGASGGPPMERLFVRALVPEIDRRYRTIAAPVGRALLGVSMGGYAAFNLGLRHPDMFGALAAHSGYFVAEEDDEVALPLLGSDPRRLRENSPFDRVATDGRRWSGRLYFDCGVDDDLAKESQQFHHRLQQARIAHHYALVPGDHSWDTWRQRLPTSLRFIQHALRGLALQSETPRQVARRR